MSAALLRHLAAISLFAGAQAFAAPGAAETSASLPQRAPRIGFVDVERVLDRSDAIRTLVAEIDDELGERARVIDAKRRDLKKLQVELERQSTVLAETERRARQQRALDLVAEIDELEFKFQRDVRRKRETAIEPLLEQVLHIVADVGRRDGFDLVVRGEMVLYGRNSVDLTPAVVEETNRRLEDLRRAMKTAPPKPLEPRTTPVPSPAKGPAQSSLPVIP